MTFCTVVTQNYLPRARVLAASLAVFHPRERLTVLVVDASHADAEELFETVTPADLPLDTAEFHLQSVIYDAFELANALKPWLLRYVLDSGNGPAVYVDADVELFAAIEDVLDLVRSHVVVLTPHSTRPMPRDAKSPEERDVLETGMYNAGFVGVSSGAESFLDWWAARLRRHCLDARSDSLFVDQRWLDLVPSYFDHHVLRDRGSNVAFWNLSPGDLRKVNGRYEVNETPLRFFHYSGFDPEHPQELWSRSGTRYPLRVSLRDEPALRSICHSYAQKLVKAGHRDALRVGYGFAKTADGLPLDRRARRLYRTALLEAEAADVRTAPPDPFDPRQSRAFARWLQQAAPRAGLVSRYLQALYDERLDLQIAFPDLENTEDAVRFFAWVRVDGARAEPPVPDALVPKAGDTVP